MKLNKRLDNLQKNIPSTDIILVRYKNEVFELSAGEKIYLRNENEDEVAFIERIKSVVRLTPNSHNILVANF
jgi:hypothetical protein